MNSKDLFTIVIKVMGLLMLPEIFTVASQCLNALRFLNGNFGLGEIAYTVFCIVILLIYILVVRLFLFKTEVLVQKIVPAGSLENEFNSFKIHRSTVLTICVIVTGGFILVNEVPNIIRNIYVYRIESNDFSDTSASGSFQFIVLSGVKILLGLFLIYSNRTIINWIESQRKQ